MAITIRKYKEGDKEALRNICRVTANGRYSASDVGLAAVTVLYNDYYTENEPESIFVAVDENDIPIGYILCSKDYKKYTKAMLGKYLKKVAKTAFKYLPDAFAEVITLWLLPNRYRTHLHIDILPEYQKQGIGTNLVDALREYLAGNGLENLSVASIGVDTLGYKFYNKYGFKKVKSFGFGEVAVSIQTKK